jgi:hypothetical protein
LTINLPVGAGTALCTLQSSFGPTAMTVTPQPGSSTQCNLDIPGGFPNNSQIVATAQTDWTYAPIASINGGMASIHPGYDNPGSTEIYSFIIAVPPTT